MSVIVIAVATESGVPIFSRKRGNHEGVQFSTIASLHGINMFSKCHNLKIMNTEVDNGSIVWKEYCKSVTLIGIATGGLECNLELLLSCTHDAMVFYIGKKELESMKNIDQIKRDLRQCYPTLDYLLQSVDPNAESGSLPTLLLDLIPSVLCPQAHQLQQVLDQYSCRVSGRWACLSVHGRLAACGSDVTELHPRELRLLLLSSARDGAPLRETPVYLPWTSPDVAFRAVTCKLLADVYVTVVCGATPPLSQIDEIVLQCWESHAQLIKEAKLVYPRNFPTSIAFEPCVLGVLAVQVAARRSALLGGARSGRRRSDVLATFYVTAAARLAQPQTENDNNSTTITETYWSTEYHKCHAQRSGDLLCCVLYAASVPTHTTRLITSQILQDLGSNKDVYW